MCFSEQYESLEAHMYLSEEYERLEASAHVLF